MSYFHPFNPPSSGNKPEASTPTGPLQKHTKAMVTLYAGQSEEKHLVHKDFLCHQSPVLKAALNSSFLEGQTQSYRFEEAPAEEVRLLIDWCYTHKIDFYHQHKDPDRTQMNTELPALLGLWILAEKYMIPSLQNLIIAELQNAREQTNKTPYRHFKYVWKNTGPGSLLRKYLVDLILSHPDKSKFNSHSELFFPREMLVEILYEYNKEYLKTTRDKWLPRKHMADYMVKDAEEKQDNETEAIGPAWAETTIQDQSSQQP